MMDHDVSKNVVLREVEAASGSEEDKVEKRLQLMLNEGSKLPVHADDTAMVLPDYYDAEKFRLGQEVFKKNIFTMMIAKLSGLLILLAIPSVLNILKFTKQSGTPCAAFRRYASTILHTCIWYKSTPNQDAEFFKSLKNVRWKHHLASQRCSEAKVGRISQLDMALTQFGFMGFSLLSADTLGIYASEKELDGLLHFWRVIGRILGTEERFNLCNGTVEETKALCRRILEVVFIPNVTKSTKDFDEMSQALLEGLWPINPFIDNHAYKAITYHLIVSAVSNNNNNNNNLLNFSVESMPIYSKFLLNLQLSVHAYLLQTRFWWSGLFRYFFNNQMKLSIYLTEKFPFLAYWLFGRNNSHYNIYKYHLD